MDNLILVVFLIHSGVAAGFFILRKETVYGIMATVFICLLLSALINTYVPFLAVGGIRVALFLRIAAFVMAFVGLLIRLANRFGRRTREEQ